MWFLFALLSAIIWGLNYVLYEKLVQKISISSLYFITSMISTIVFLCFSLINKSISRDFQIILSSKQVQFFIVLNIITYILANISIALAIQSKNAALSGLIEISYPIFIILIAALFFHENHLSLSVIIGGLLIFSGIGIIYFFNK